MITRFIEFTLLNEMARLDASPWLITNKFSCQSAARRKRGVSLLPFTVIGGTGLLGLVLGIAFRDIAENFLASILLSVQSPFRTGDIVEVAGVSGIVQQLNVRTTVLMAPIGNQVQIPNAIVYKSMIRNFTSNPNRRDDFVVGIGYDVSITDAQEIALKVLAEHPAVLKSPEPWVLVDNLGPATVNLRVYFWIDGGQYSWLRDRLRLADADIAIAPRKSTNQPH